MNPNLEIAITNRVLNCIHTRRWKDYDNFSAKLSCQIIERDPKTSAELISVVKSFIRPFYTLNNITPDILVEVLPIQDMLNLLSKYHEIGPLTFTDVFPETSSVTITEGKKLLLALATLPEGKIQETLVDSLREKNATNCRDRTNDTVLEVGDLEHFSVKVQGVPTTFAAVVKGFKSVSGRTVTWENIAHQVTKVYRTRPDHILVVLAKNAADSVISELVQYAKTVGNQNLIVTCDPVELARFLKARHIL